MKKQSIQLSKLRYENIPYRKGRVPRIWVQDTLTYKTFFKDLLNDIWKLLKWFKKAYRKEFIVGSVLLLALLPEPVKAAPLPIHNPPLYIQPISHLEPVPVVQFSVPEEVTPVAVPEPVAAPVVAPTGDAKSYALSLVGSSQFACLEPLWNKESGWNPYAVNSIGAMGIPQALGHGQVFALGDWKAQVDWGLNYISATYGTSCSAWAHSQAYNWY